MSTTHQITFLVTCDADPSSMLDAAIATIPELAAQLDAVGIRATCNEQDVSVELGAVDAKHSSAVPKPSFEDALGRFVGGCQAIVDKYFATHFPTLTPDRLQIDPRGRKYVRIVSACYRADSDEPASRSVYCFVDRTNGNVLKSRSWKAPETKNPRGSIYADNPFAGVTPNGTCYLR